MRLRKDELTVERVMDLLERHWKWAVLISWLLVCAWFIFDRWNAIRFFQLGDTDDNMRMMQVRALLHGQEWFDLRQYRLNPPIGSNIHWSRLVDLPIAGLILLLRPLIGGATAERWAVGIAPLLPYLLLLFSVGLTVRRLIDPRAYILAFAALFFAGSTNGMFMPERIDHHGWQLAFLALAIAGIADPKKLRGGLTLGFATALSLTIGLEMLVYLALAGVAQALFWVIDRDERDRLGAYALSLSAGTTVGFLLFASYANRAPVCDALSPVWLSDALLGGALLFGLAWLSPADWKRRLALAAVAGIAVAAFHALMWPHCLHRLEGVSPEVDRLWLSHVREARPVYTHGRQVASLVLALPITGTIGWLMIIWANRADREKLRRMIAAAVPGFAALALLFWQTRTGPAAQMLAATGAAGLTWLLFPYAWKSKWSDREIFGVSLRVVATAALVVIGAGAAVPLVIDYIPTKPKTVRDRSIDRANNQCASLWGYHPIALLPKGTVFTFIDLAPRLITVTHHDSITGPYHRNGQQIADVMNAFRGDADQARVLIGKYHADYLLTCPNSSTTTIFMSEAPRGFYTQLQRGDVPDWLTPIPLPANSPFKIWKVAR
ncbi:MAG TPA: AcrB/AcrD/AcrF family protein [Sphingomicrobium sp.]|nr:AcrB/AcrD/AcrF family protein [Sphingomicrobium sp.]